LYRLVAEGSASGITIKAGETNEDTVITLHPKESEDGTGTLSFTLNTDPNPLAGFELGAFTLSPVFGDELPIDVLGLPELADVEKIKMDISYSVDVPAGYYLLSMTLVRTLDDKSTLANKSEVVHIFRNQVTDYEYCFPASNFIENIVTNTLDSYRQDEKIPGSLRYAIEDHHQGNAAAGQRN